MGVSEDDRELLKPNINTLLMAFTDAHKHNTSKQVKVDLTPNHQKGDNHSTMMEEPASNMPTPTASWTLPTK